MAERSIDEVPGMADRVERRRRELGLGPTQFARAAGVTAQALIPVRKGYRRNYQDKLKAGVAHALRWRYDAIDRLLAGEDPIPMDASVSSRSPMQIAALTGEMTDDELNEAREALQAIIDRRRT